MPKNNFLIEQAKQIAEIKKGYQQAIKRNVAEIYACFAKVLIDDYHNTEEEVVSLFARTQEVWNELAESEKIQGMIQWCEEVTGVKLVSDEQEAAELEKENT